MTRQVAYRLVDEEGAFLQVATHTDDPSYISVTDHYSTGAVETELVLSKERAQYVIEALTQLMHGGAQHVAEVRWIGDK